MNPIIIFYDNKSKYADEKIFDGKSSVDLSKEWADEFSPVQITIGKCENLTELLEKMCIAIDENQADYVIFSFKDLPFLNKNLTKELISFHEKYKSEYTFADGYPYGFAPELIHGGTVKILCEISKNSGKTEGEKKVTSESLFNLIKTDINSFDVESVIADEDWRLFRYRFDCSKKENFIACKNLFSLTKDLSDKKLFDFPVNDLCRSASVCQGILKTVPAYYNLQICDKSVFNSIYSPYFNDYEQSKGCKPDGSDKIMNFDRIFTLVKNIAEYSENAVINLSAWGEPFFHPDLLKIIENILSYSGLSVFIETDGLLVTEEFCEKLKKIVDSAEERTNGFAKVMISVTMDSFTAPTYNRIHNVSQGFDLSFKSISLLSRAVPGCVYPQFVRMNQNENELESFYRYWNDKNNSSLGNLIIQKYDDFCGKLPPCKSADLSPLERNVCWHIRRDMTILSNGDVPFCREFVFDNIAGNVFEEGIDSIWKKFDLILKEHIECKYNDKCRKCDEFYTYNF